MRNDEPLDAHLESVAADCAWEGPVLRAHKRPVDPKYWDKHPIDKDPDLRYSEMHDTFELAGIWAVKTREQAVYVARIYGGAVYGRIKLWGRVAQFTLGFRAEACMIDELWLVAKSLHLMWNPRNDQRDYELVAARIKKIAIALENRYQCKVNIE